jgi:hypothetical protein
MRASKRLSSLINQALRCPECGHTEAEMDCTCGDDLCPCYIQSVQTELDQQKWENDRGLE